MPKLSVFIPSHSDYKSSSLTLLNAYALSRLSGVEVIVSDNSGDDTKQAAWSPLSDDSFKYLKSPHAGASQNSTHAFASTTGEWCCFLSDDDQLIALPGFDVNEWQITPNVIGICPTMTLYSESQGIYRTSNMLLDQARAVDRIRHYLNNHGGANTTLFSSFRRDISVDLSEAISKHPTRGGYNDWAIVLALISSGPLVSCPRLQYIYNNRNWGSTEEIERNTKRTFTDVGLGEDNSQILFAHLALDSIVFICRAKSPIENAEKLEAGEFALNAYFSAFLNSIDKAESPRNMDAERLKICRSLVKWASDTPKRIASLLVVIETWNPGLAEKYVKFMLEVTDPVISSTLLSQLKNAPTSLTQA